MLRRAAWPLAAWVGALGLLSPSPAPAYEDAWTVGLGAGLHLAPALVAEADGDRPGGALALEASRGLDDAWSVRLAAGAAWQPGADETGGLGWAALDLAYALDLLEVVPYAAAGLEGLVPLGTDAPPRPALRLAVGLDWLFDWDHYAGLELAAAWFRAPGGTMARRLLLTARFGWRMED